MRISDWSSDVCSSDLKKAAPLRRLRRRPRGRKLALTARPTACAVLRLLWSLAPICWVVRRNMSIRTIQPMSNSYSGHRSEEHTSELQSLMRISYAVFCLKKKKIQSQKLSYILNKSHHQTKIITRQLTQYNFTNCTVNIKYNI